MDDIFVRCIPLPPRVKGFTMAGSDGYNVYINDSLPQVDRVKVYEHELKHIRRGDFSDGNVQRMELVAHGEIKA